MNDLLIPGGHSRALLSRRLAALAGEQRGVVSRAQLLDAGWSAATVERRVGDRTLAVLHPGVYAVGHRALTRDGWLQAAVLACGEDGVLVGRAAAAARDLLPARSRIDVATSTRRGLQLPGLRAHRLRLRPEEREHHRGLPVTTLARTALDVAATEPADRVGELLDRALLERQYCHREMRELLRARAGCRGVAVLRAELAKLGEQATTFRSRPERLARDLLLAAGLPPPRVNAWQPTRVGHGHELDLWWPGPRKDLELDGPHHAMPRQRRLDALRDADLRALGIDVLRLPTTLVVEAPERFVARVAAWLATW